MPDPDRYSLVIKGGVRIESEEEETMFEKQLRALLDQYEGGAHTINLIPLAGTGGQA